MYQPLDFTSCHFSYISFDFEITNLIQAGDALSGPRFIDVQHDRRCVTFLESQGEIPSPGWLQYSQRSSYTAERVRKQHLLPSLTILEGVLLNYLGLTGPCQVLSSGMVDVSVQDKLGFLRGWG